MMKANAIVLSIVLAIIVAISSVILYTEGYFGGYVAQDTSDRTGVTRLRTFVWKNGEIIHGWFDYMDSVVVHPEIPKTRISQAKQLLKSLQ